MVSFDNLRAATEQSRAAVEARFLPPSDEGEHPDDDDQDPEETEDGGEAPDRIGTLSDEVIDRLLETASRPAPRTNTPTEEDLDEEDPAQGGGIDAGRRTPAKRVETVSAQFHRAIVSGHGSHNSPRTLEEAFQRRGRKPRVFDIPR